jgi:predicted homoserine dehydrogenase-like protein
VARSGANAKMFNSFIDGTKSAIEMAAVSNATGLLPPSDGLLFPPAGAEELQDVLRPSADGGVLERTGTVEVVASLQRDGSIVERDLRWGVYVVFRGDTEYVRECFQQYGLVTDASGHYAALYRPYHLIGLEVGISVASAALRNEPTGAPVTWLADVVATAKRDLRSGETLDGEGGYCVWGKLVPAERSLTEHLIPIGLSHNVQLVRDVKAGQIVTWADITPRANDEAIHIRREMESQFKPFS